MAIASFILYVYQVYTSTVWVYRSLVGRAARLAKVQTVPRAGNRTISPPSHSFPLNTKVVVHRMHFQLSEYGICNLNYPIIISPLFFELLRRKRKWIRPRFPHLSRGHRVDSTLVKGWDEDEGIGTTYVLLEVQYTYNGCMRRRMSMAQTSSLRLKAWAWDLQHTLLGCV